MSLFAAIAVAVLLAKVALMIDGRVPSDVIAMGMIVVLVVTGTLPTNEALMSFGNESVVINGILDIVILGLVYSGATFWLAEHFFVKKITKFRFLVLRVMVPVTISSALISADAIVNLFINVVRLVGKRINVAPSRLLIPMGYASALGAMCTLIGSPSNLVVANFFNQETGQVMSLLDPLLPGVFCAVIGTITVVFLRKRIPVRKAPEDSFSNSSDYTVELLVPTESEVVGSTIEESGLNNVPGGHLVEIVRFDREVISPVPQDEFLLGGDHLVYTGQINSILNLKKSHGLVNATHHVFKVDEISGNRHLQVANIHQNSSLIGKKMIDTSFEERNNVVLVAIARQGQRVEGIPREIVLRAGDTLLLEGQKLLQEHFRDNLNFFDSELLPARTNNTFLSMIILMGMLLLSAFNVVPMLHSCMIAAAAMVVCKCCNFSQVQRAINWKIILIFSASVCLGKALVYTGVASAIGDFVSQVSADSPFTALVIIASTATLVSELMGNELCAAVFTPIAIQTAMALDANPMTFCISVLISINASFATPLGSTVNTQIYGPGGYKFTDFMRIGIPLNIIILIANVFIVSLVYPL